MRQTDAGRLGAVAATLAVAVLVGVMLAPDRLPPSTPSTVIRPSGPAQAEPEGLITVHVSGWVMVPGLVRVGAGALVADAIAAAGGARAGANLDGVNLASPVDDGGQVDVPGPEAQDVVESGGGLVDLNRADESQLQTLPGVGPVLASRIAAYRESNGRFEAVEDLLDVPGIGEAKLASLADLIVIR